MGGRRGGKARGRAAAPPALMQLERGLVLRGCRDGLAGFQDDEREDRPVLGCETEHSEGDRRGRDHLAGARVIACGWRSLSGIVGDSGALTEQQDEQNERAGEGKP